MIQLNFSTVNCSLQPPQFIERDRYFCDGKPAYKVETCNVRKLLFQEGSCARCASSTNPPWFYRQLPVHTTDNIEMRVCHDQPRSDEDIAIETFEIYIQ